MALEGNLADFSLRDMFRLLEAGSKTGMLHVESPSGRGAVCFTDGRICHASVGLEQTPVVKRLASEGVVSEKQLRQARGLVKIQKRDKAPRRLGRVLVDEGYIEEAKLEDFVLGEVALALFDLLRWEEGELRFVSDESCGDADLGISVDVEDALTATEERLAVWKEIAETIPTPDTTFTISSAPVDQKAEIQLKPREWMMLCYLHGGRSVAELAALTGDTEFEVSKTLYGMHAGGLVELAQQGSPVNG